MGATVPLDEFVALHAVLDTPRIFLTGKLGSDEVAELLAEPAGLSDGLIHFYISHFKAAPVTPAPLYRELTSEELPVLLATLKKQEHHPPGTLDLGILRMFVHELAHKVHHPPSARFEGARFGAIVRAAHDGIFGHFGIGIDVAGTLHDTRRSITVEDHVVPLPPNRFRRLNEADRESLAVALDSAIERQSPPVDRLWEEVLQDVRGMLRRE
jgi:hypothetical protein